MKGFLLSILLIFIISNGSLVHIYILLSQHNQVDGWGHVRLLNRINLDLIEILCVTSIIRSIMTWHSICVFVDI